MLTASEGCTKIFKRCRNTCRPAKPKKTAMMMVVFFDAGIKPGPDIFDNNPDFLFSLFVALLIINVLVLITRFIHMSVLCVVNKKKIASLIFLLLKGNK